IASEKGSENGRDQAGWVFDERDERDGRSGLLCVSRFIGGKLRQMFGDDVSDEPLGNVCESVADLCFVKQQRLDGLELPIEGKGIIVVMDQGAVEFGEGKG